MDTFCPYLRHWHPSFTWKGGDQGGGRGEERREGHARFAKTREDPGREWEPGTGLHAQEVAVVLEEFTAGSHLLLRQC